MNPTTANPQTTPTLNFTSSLGKSPGQIADEQEALRLKGSAYSNYNPQDSLHNTPVNTTISADNIANVKSVNVPPSQTGASSAASRAIGSSQGALLSLSGAGTNEAQNKYDQTQADTQALINEYSGKGQDQLDLENAANTPQLKIAAQQATRGALISQQAYNQQYNDILHTAGTGGPAVARQIADLQQQHGYDLTDQTIRATLLNDDYTNAEELINHKIDLKYSTLKDQINFGMQFLQNNQSILSEKQKQQFESQLQVQNQTYTQGVYYDQLNEQTKVQMVKDAAAQGAPDDIKQAIYNAPDIGSAATAGGEYLQNGNYTVTQTGIDQNTGLPIYSKFNPKTGNLEPLNYNGALGSTGSSDTIVNGYQMGASTTMGAYASATGTQVNNIKATTARIQAAVGTITDVTSAQAAISAVSPKSPITGDMIMSAATKYGIDPATLIGVMQAETRCGTDGSKGAKECNWGNVGNTDSLMASGKSVAMKPQDGVDAVARNLAERKVQQNQNDPAQAPVNGTLSPQQIATQSIKAAPALLQPAMNFTASTGGVFIDKSKVPTNLEVMMQSYASRSGIPILDKDQVEVVKGADEAIRNITEVISPAWNEISPNGTLGKIGLQTLSIPSGLLDTDKNAKIKTFISNRENLAQQIRALSQSAPKGSLLSTAESALPDIGGYGFHFGTGKIDSTKIGNSKMQRTLDLLNQTVKSYLPNAKSVTLPEAQGIKYPDQILNGKVMRADANGNYNPI